MHGTIPITEALQDDISSRIKASNAFFLLLCASFLFQKSLTKKAFTLRWKLIAIHLLHAGWSCMSVHNAVCDQNDTGCFYFTKLIDWTIHAILFTHYFYVMGLPEPNIPLVFLGQLAQEIIYETVFMPNGYYACVEGKDCGHRTAPYAWGFYFLGAWFYLTCSFFTIFIVQNDFKTLYQKLVVERLSWYITQVAYLTFCNGYIFTGDMQYFYFAHMTSTYNDVCFAVNDVDFIEGHEKIEQYSVLKELKSLYKKNIKSE